MCRREYNIKAMCHVFKVSKSGCYRCIRCSGISKPWQQLLVKIRQIYAQYPGNGNYGVNRIKLALE